MTDFSQIKTFQCSFTVKAQFLTTLMVFYLIFSLNDCYQKNKKEKTILSHLLHLPKTLSHWLECRFKELLSEGAFNNNETLGEKHVAE